MAAQPLYEVTASYTYSAEDSAELSFKPGDQISVLRNDGDWCYGILNGSSELKGWFPRSYVTGGPNLSKVIDQALSNIEDSESIERTSGTKLAVPETVVTIYNYTAVEPDEMSFKVGEVLVVTEKSTDGWYFCKYFQPAASNNSTSGWCPSNYFRPLDVDEPTSAVDLVKTFAATAPNPGPAPSKPSIFGRVVSRLRSSDSPGSKRRPWSRVYDAFIRSPKNSPKTRRHTTVSVSSPIAHSEGKTESNGRSTSNSMKSLIGRLHHAVVEADLGIDTENEQATGRMEAEHEYVNVDDTNILDQSSSNCTYLNDKQQRADGIIEANKLSEEPSKLQQQLSQQAKAAATSESVTGQNPENYVIALFDCIGDDDDELSFSKGDLIEISSSRDVKIDWWEGILIGSGTEKAGLLPRTYVRELYPEEIAVMNKSAVAALENDQGVGILSPKRTNAYGEIGAVLSKLHARHSNENLLGKSVEPEIYTPPQAMRRKQSMRYKKRGPARPPVPIQQIKDLPSDGRIDDANIAKEPASLTTNIQMPSEATTAAYYNNSSCRKRAAPRPAVVIEAHDATLNGELSFNVGDVIITKSWLSASEKIWEGTLLSKNVTGQFPSAKVKLTQAVRTPIRGLNPSSAILRDSEVSA